MQELIEKIQNTYQSISVFRDIVFNNDGERGTLMVQRGEVKCIICDEFCSPHIYETFIWKENRLYQAIKSTNLPYEYKPIDNEILYSLFISKFPERKQYEICKNELKLIYDFLLCWTKLKYKNLPVDSIEFIEKEIYTRRWIEQQDNPLKIKVKWFELVVDDEFKSLRNSGGQENRLDAEDRFGLSKKGNFLWDFEISLDPEHGDSSSSSSFYILCKIKGDWWSGRDHSPILKTQGDEDIFWLYIKKETGEIAILDPSHNNIKLPELLDRILKQIERQDNQIQVYYGV
jgi:hypothetical protein